MNLKFSRVVQFIGALLLAFGLAGAAQAQISDINSAINKAGRERMLSQRMAKAWHFQLGLGVDVDRSKRVLDSLDFPVRPPVGRTEELRADAGDQGHLPEARDGLDCLGLAGWRSTEPGRRQEGTGAVRTGIGAGAPGTVQLEAFRHDGRSPG